MGMDSMTSREVVLRVNSKLGRWLRYWRWLNLVFVGWLFLVLFVGQEFWSSFLPILPRSWLAGVFGGSIGWLTRDWKGSEDLLCAKYLADLHERGNPYSK